MEHDGHRLRMRERYLAGGLDGFAPHEVLELLLFYAIPQKNVNPVAHALMERFGSLHAVLEASADQLKQVKGIGEYAATYLTLYAQVAKQAELSRVGARETLSNRKMAEDHCIRLLAGFKREHFYAVCLNAQMQVLNDSLIAKGSLSEVPSYPRLVAEAALTHNAHSVLLCHNHPGGSLIPSQGDMEATRQLGELLKGLEIVLVDHVIVAGGKALSMVSHHLIEQEISPWGIVTKVADPAGEVRIRHKLKKQEKLELSEEL